jgi:hypothetical protein
MHHQDINQAIDLTIFFIKPAPLTPRNDRRGRKGIDIALKIQSRNMANRQKGPVTPLALDSE